MDCPGHHHRRAMGASPHEVIQDAEVRVKISKRSVEVEALLKAVIILVGKKHKEEKKAPSLKEALLAVKGLKVLHTVKPFREVPWSGHYHLERLWVNTVTALQDTKAPNPTIAETAMLGLSSCEQTWTASWGTQSTKKMHPVEGIPLNFSLLVNNLLASYGKAVSLDLEKGPAPSEEDWALKWKQIVKSKHWVSYHWSLDNTQYYYRITLAHSAMVMAKHAPTARAAITPVKEGLRQVAYCKNANARNVSFLGSTSYAMFAASHAAWKDRQQAIIASLAASAGTDDKGNPEKFNRLREVRAEHFGAFSKAAKDASSDYASERIYRILHLACLDTLVTLNAELISNYAANLEYLAKLTQYEGDESVHIWCQHLRYRLAPNERTAVSAATGIASCLYDVDLFDAGDEWAHVATSSSKKKSETTSLEAAFMTIKGRLNRDSGVGQYDFLDLIKEIPTFDSKDPKIRELDMAARHELTNAALKTGNTEAAVCAGEQLLAMFFRTDPLISVMEKPHTMSVLHFMFSLLYSYTEALLIRGEVQTLNKILSQAVKIQACSAGSFSPLSISRILFRRGQAMLLLKSYTEAEANFTDALEILTRLLPKESSLVLKLNCLLHLATARHHIGNAEGALEIVKTAEQSLLPCLTNEKLTAALKTPWEAVLGNVHLQPIPHIEVLRKEEDGKKLYEVGKAMVNVKKGEMLLRNGVQEGERLINENVGLLTDPRDMVQGRLAVAETQDVAPNWRLTRVSKKTGHEAMAEDLMAALDAGAGIRGPALLTRSVSLELSRRMSRLNELEAVHYLNTSQGWTTRHQTEGIRFRKQTDPMSFKGEWFSDLDAEIDHTNSPEAYIDKLQAMLPDAFAVVTINETKDGDLLIGRIESNEEPIVVAISDMSEEIRECLTGLNRILTEAKEHVHQVDKSKVENTDYKRQWWERREAYDTRLKKNIERVGDKILTWWRGLVLGQPLNPATRDQLRFVESKAMAALSTLALSIHGREMDIDCRLLRHLIHSVPHLYTGLKHDAKPKKETGPNGEPLYWRSTTAYIFEALKDLLEADNLSGGLKIELRNIAAEIHHEVARIIPPGTKCNRQHVLLVLGHLHRIPWEASSALEGEPASRIPSLHYLVEKLETTPCHELLSREIDPKSVYYVLNPDGNLSKTESKFKWFTRKEGWEGQVGKLPGTVNPGLSVGARPPENIEEERKWKKKWLDIFRRGNTEYDVFIYMGHGTGEQFVAQKDIKMIPVMRGKADQQQTPVIRTPRKSKGPKSPASLIGEAPPPLSPVGFEYETPKKLFSDWNVNSPEVTVPSTRKRKARYSLTPQKVERAENSMAVALLMGCSSGQLTDLQGEIDPDGVAYSFLVGGTPTLVGNLWDVTDGEIDRYSENLLRTWLSSPSAPLTSAVEASRSQVKLRYLIGSAPVVYGMPLNPVLF